MAKQLLLRLQVILPAFNLQFYCTKLKRIIFRIFTLDWWAPRKSNLKDSIFSGYLLDFNNFVLKWLSFSISVISSLRFQFYISLWCLLSVLSVLTYSFLRQQDREQVYGESSSMFPQAIVQGAQVQICEREEARALSTWVNISRDLGCLVEVPEPKISQMTLLLPPARLWCFLRKTRSCLAHPQYVNLFGRGCI